MNKIPAASFLALLLSVAAMPAIAQENVTYSINLGNQNSNIGRCAVNVGIDGVGAIDLVASAPNYAVSFNIPASQNKNHLVKVKGIIKWGLPPNNAPACSVDGEIYINQIILDEWKPINEKFAGTESLRCVNLGVRRVNESIDGSPASQKLFLRPSDSTSKKIFEVCDELLTVPLEKNVACDVTDGKVKSVCDEDFFSPTNPNRKLSFEAALYARLEGQEVRRGLWETTAAHAARAERQAKEDEQRRLREEERQKIAKQREEREAWLKTPAGKKYLAEEDAKRRKAEEERQKAEAAEKARLTKEFPYYAEISCGWGGSNFPVYACFSRDHGSMEITNGSDYGLYKLLQVANGLIPNTVRSPDTSVMQINLRRKFKIRARNGKEKWIMGIKIIDRSSGAIVFQKQVDQFGIIAIEN